MLHTGNRDMGKFLKEMSSGNLADIFDFISMQTQEIIWICSNDYTKQLYLSPAFKNTRGLERETIYEHRELFPTTILQEDINALMPDFLARQQGLCERTLAYRIQSSDKKTHFIKDICFGISDIPGNQVALFGLAKPVSVQEWEEIKTKKPIQSFQHASIQKNLAQFVTQNLKLNCAVSKKPIKKPTTNNFYLTTENQQINFTPREAQCLVYLLKGQEFKVMAKQLNISPRTVETHFIKIKEKMRCRKVIELVSKIENRKQISEWIFSDIVSGD